jgi:hypothetical protein
MEATPEPENLDSSKTSGMPRFDDREADNFTQMPFDDAPGLEALSAAATSNYGYIRPISNPAQSPVSTIMPHPSSNNLNFILNPAVPEGAIGMYNRTSQNYQLLKQPALEDTERSPLSPILALSPNAFSVFGVAKPVVDHEIAFLLRHFSETAGQWYTLTGKNLQDIV